MLGNKNSAMLRVFAHDPAQQAALRNAPEARSLYDEFLCCLARRGHAVPARPLGRDWSEPHRRDPELVPVFKRICDRPRESRVEYELREKMVDVEERFQLRRFRHMKTVERVIGFKHGTGGSSGVDFLRRALELTFFSKLLGVRTEIVA